MHIEEEVKSVGARFFDGAMGTVLQGKGLKLGEIPELFNFTHSQLIESVHLSYLEAGADYVGLDEYLQKIKEGWTDVDVIVTMPAVMGKLGPLGRILGPRGLMPNPKSGTVTMEVGKAVAEVKAGKIDFKVDKYGIIHAGIGKVSFDAAKLKENAAELIHTLIKLKPTAAKGTYVKSIYLSSTMSPGIAIDTKSVN